MYVVEMGKVGYNFWLCVDGRGVHVKGIGRMMLEYLKLGMETDMSACWCVWALARTVLHTPYKWVFITFYLTLSKPTGDLRDWWITQPYVTKDNIFFSIKHFHTPPCASMWRRRLFLDFRSTPFPSPTLTRMQEKYVFQKDALHPWLKCLYSLTFSITNYKGYHFYHFLVYRT